MIGTGVLQAIRPRLRSVRWVFASSLGLLFAACSASAQLLAAGGAVQPLLPDAPLAQGAAAQTAAVRGTVTDPNGALVPQATVTLAGAVSSFSRTVLTNASGFFEFAAVPPGPYKITIAARGFATWVQTDIPVEAGVDQDLAHIVLPVGSTTTDVQVFYTQHEIAEQQLHVEEKQRVYGVFPNFYSSYVWHAAPLSAGQKMRLAVHAALDPTAFLGAGVAAGVEQARNDFPGYGQGAQGYAKRYGAAYADGFIGSIVGDGLLPSLLRQDPRFFYKADGTVRQRAFYAVSLVAIRRGDNGKWQPNYSGILGNLASGAISNAYYPSTDRGAGLTIRNAFIGEAFGGIGELLREFVVPRLTTGGPPKTQP